MLLVLCIGRKIVTIVTSLDEKPDERGAVLI